MPAPINWLVGSAGSNRAINPRELPEAMCVDIVDAEPGRGDFRPLKQHAIVATVPASPQRNTIWRMGRESVNDALYWLSWSAVVNATLGFGTDSTERTYYTGDGTPKWTSNAIALGSVPYPQASRELAVPAPDLPPMVSVTSAGSGTPAERFYVETFVNDLGWESAPSPASTALLCAPGSIVNIQLVSTPPAGNYGFTARRIYRTQPDNENNAEFFFLREVAIGSASTTDDARALGDLLPTYNGTSGSRWTPPPSNAFGIIALWNGMFALLSGKNLHFSEPGAPYAYPVRYDRTLRDTPVATASWQQNLLVLTVGRPVMFQGQDPAGMSDTPIPASFACRSARSVVSFEHGVVWASSEGLAYTGSASLLTEGILTADQWKALSPDTMIAGRWGKFYVCSYLDTSRKAFMFDPLNPGNGIWWLSQGFDACHYDPLADALYILGGGEVKKFAGGVARFTAKSVAKEFMQTAPVNFGAAKVVASSYPVTLTVKAKWRDSAGAEQTSTETRTVTSDRSIKLKSGFSAESWQPEVQSAGDIQAVRLAVCADELKGI